LRVLIASGDGQRSILSRKHIWKAAGTYHSTTHSLSCHVVGAAQGEAHCRSAIDMNTYCSSDFMSATDCTGMLHAAEVDALLGFLQVSRVAEARH